MAHDQSLAERIRKALAGMPGITEQQKMGGISFMKKGHVVVRAHSDGSMMLRCDPEMTDDLLRKKGAQRFAMKGKANMRGWLIITAEGTATDKALAFWIDVALAFNDMLA